MMKRIISLALCLLMLVSVFAGCAKKEEGEEDKGAYITMYITDPVYNFDPAQAYGNESALKIVSLMFDNLFVLDDNGKVKNSLAKDYKVYENEETQEYKMTITLRETSWSDNTPVSANDVVYAWKRILDPANSFGAAALLYDIKYAREAKEGDVSIDAVRMYAPNDETVEIYFNGKIDYKRFVRNLTCYALAPLREDIVSQAADPVDWAKSPTIFESSGPFILREISYTEESAGLILERNVYYYRDFIEDDLDKSVTPYRLIVDYSKTPEEIIQGYNDGSIFYVGNIPLSVRASVKDQAEVTDALSTHTYVLNQNAEIAKADGSTAKLFADANVRQALSLAIDRTAIANAVVFAKAATGLVPYGVYNENSKKDQFREAGGDLIATTAAMDQAKSLLSTAGINAADYSFSISVSAYDDVHMEIAKQVQEAWGESGLGFKVSINALDVIDNEDIDNTTKDRIPGIKDDVFAEEYSAGNFEVAAIDYTAYSVDAFSVLAPFAKYYTGNAYTVSDITTGRVLSEGIPTHISGYDSEEYNTKIDEAFKANTDTASRTALLHEAEKKLMEDMPVIPIIFNQNATLTHKNLSKCDFTYYGAPQFAKLKLKDYELYIPADQK